MPHFREAFFLFDGFKIQSKDKCLLTADSADMSTTDNPDSTTDMFTTNIADSAKNYAGLDNDLEVILLDLF